MASPRPSSGGDRPWSASYGITTPLLSSPREPLQPIPSKSATVASQASRASHQRPGPVPVESEAAAFEGAIVPSVAATSASLDFLRAVDRGVALAGPLPFAASRSRDYAHRIETLVAPIVGAAGFAGNSSFPGAVMGARTAATAGRRDGAGGAEPRAESVAESVTHARTFITALPHPGGSPPWRAAAAAEAAAAALGELESVKSDLAKVETLLGALRPPGERSTMGRQLKPRPLRAAVVLSRSPAEAWGRQQRRWEQQVAATLAPLGRAEATLLHQTLESRLPAGALGSLVTAAMRREDLAFDTVTFEREYELVDLLLREAALQVGAACAERGDLLEALRCRYVEFFSCALGMLTCLQGAHVASRAAAAAAESESAAAMNESLTLRAAAAGLREENADLRTRGESLAAELADARETAAAAAAQFGAERTMLARQIGHYEGRLALGAAQTDEAVRAAVSDLEDANGALVDERDDLLQRVKFLERQLAKMRDSGKAARTVAFDNLGTQTDEPWPEGWVAPDTGSAREAEAEVESGVVPSPKGKEDKEDKKRRKSAKRKAGFADIVYADKPGRIRTKGYVLKIIAQMYADKLVADAICDRDGEPRLLLPEFTYDWHLHRYGLRSLADSNLVDFLASCRHYGNESYKVRTFKEACSRANLEDPKGTLAKLSFYLGAMAALTNGNVLVLFPLTDKEDEVICWVKPMRVYDAVQRIFFPAALLVVADTAAMQDFLRTKVEPLLNLQTKMYDADQVLLVFIEEYSRRQERIAARLKALFMAGDSNGDGCLTYEEFSLIIASVDKGRKEAEVVRMFRESLQLSPDGERITPDIFVAVAREHKLEPGSDAPPPSLLAAAERLNTAAFLAAHPGGGADQPGSAQGVAATGEASLRGGTLPGAGGVAFSGLPPPAGGVSFSAAGPPALRAMGSETARLVSAADVTASLAMAMEEDAAAHSTAALRADLESGLLDSLFDKARSALGESSEAYLKLTTEREAFEEAYTGRDMGEEPSAAWAAYRQLLGNAHAALVRQSSGERIARGSGMGPYANGKAGSLTGPMPDAGVGDEGGGRGGSAGGGDDGRPAAALTRKLSLSLGAGESVGEGGSTLHSHRDADFSARALMQGDPQADDGRLKNA